MNYPLHSYGRNRDDLFILRGNLALTLSTLLAASVISGDARAQDSLASIFAPIERLWSGEPDNPVGYEVSLSVSGGHDDLEDRLEAASALAAGSERGAASDVALLALARDDPARLTAALYQEGYYSGRIVIRIAGQAVDAGTDRIELPEQGPAPVEIAVETGPLFTFGEIGIRSKSGAETDEAAAQAAGLKPGAPARSGVILEAGERIVLRWKQQGHAFARLVSRDVTADHASRTVDVIFTVDPGPHARFGAVEVRGAEQFESELLRSRAAIPENAPYSPDALQSARRRLTKLDGVRGVRIMEGEAPDSEGRIPITIEVTERKPRYFGANAAISLVDGAQIGAYLGHRNLLGQGESVRLDGKVSNLGGDAAEDLEYEARLTLTRPSLADPYTDYKTALSYRHEEPDSYVSDEAKLSFGAMRQFSPTLTGELAIQGIWIQAEDAFGPSEFFMLTLPGELVHDSRDDPLDASRGWRAAIRLEPAADIMNSNTFLSSYGQVSG